MHFSSKLRRGQAYNEQQEHTPMVHVQCLCLLQRVLIGRSSQKNTNVIVADSSTRHSPTVPKTSAGGSTPHPTIPTTYTNQAPRQRHMERKRDNIPCLHTPPLHRHGCHQLSTNQNTYIWLFRKLRATPPCCQR